MNSRLFSIIFYAISLIVYLLVIYSLNKYERQKIPTKRLKNIFQYIEDKYQNIQNINKLKNEKKEESDSNLSINLYIVTVCSNENSDIFGEKLKIFIEQQNNISDKEEKTSYNLFNINSFFSVNLHIINSKMVENDKTLRHSDICKKLLSKNKPNAFIDNSYYIYINENSKQEENISFILSTSNVIEIHYTRVQENENNIYEKYINETWNILKNSFFFKTSNRILEYVPELDLNFYLASSLYNEKNYKIKKYSPEEGENEILNKNENINIDKEVNNNMDKIEDENKDNKINEINNNSNNKKNIKKLNIPVSIATWNFYDDFYYPYMRNFIERLLNIFHINIYTQIISNIDLFKISEKAEVYIKGKKINLPNNTRLIMLDKITKFTNAFDDVAFDNILKKPTYQIPKNLNLIAIFPNEEEIYFYNDLNEKIETTVSFIEWGIVHINNSFTRLKSFEKKEKKVINISEAHVISGVFVSHLREFLGLCANFTECIYNIFDSNKYDIKYLNTISKDNNSSISYSIASNDIFFSFVYHIPLINSITDYEILALIREAYTYRIIESLKNLKKFLSISNISIYIKVPLYTLKVFNSILNNIECSLNYIEGKICKFNHINKVVEEKFKYNFKNNNNKKEIYFKVALVLSQSAYQDSLQLLNDDKVSIYNILSKDFLLATMLPIVAPVILPIISAIFRELFKNFKKHKIKID